jgi:hypothetical protein
MGGKGSKVQVHEPEQPSRAATTLSDAVAVSEVATDCVSAVLESFLFEVRRKGGA